MNAFNHYVWGEATDCISNKLPGSAILLINRPHFLSIKILEDVSESMYIILKPELRYFLLPHFLNCIT